MSIIYKTAKEFIGKDIAKTLNELGCAEAVNFAVKKAIGQEVGGDVSTFRMYNSLLADKRFSRVIEPQAGDIIISPTGYGRGPGHVGIISDNENIMSNNSYTYLWDEHLTLDYWYTKYANFPIAFFRYNEIKQEEEIKKNLLERIVALYKQIITLLKK